MMFRLSLRLLLVLLSTGFSETWVQSATVKDFTLRVGIYESGPLLGWSGESVQPEGLFWDVLEAATGRLGISTVYVRGRYADLWADLQAGNIDVLPGVPEFAVSDHGNVRLGSESIVSARGRIWVRRNAGREVRSIVDLAGMDLASMKNDPDLSAISDLLNFYRIEARILLMDDLEDVAGNSEVDGIVLGRFAGGRVVTDDSFLETPVVFNEQRLFVGYAMNVPSLLAQQVDKEIEILLHDPDSAYFRSFEKWLGSEKRRLPLSRIVGRHHVDGINLFGFNPLEVVLGLLLLLALLRLRAAQCNESSLKKELRLARELEKKLRDELKSCRTSRSGDQ